MARDTHDSILDAAERVFAQKGFQAASLRDITRKARANLASVHYHFGSKDGLVRAVLSRRAGELNGARLQLLDAAAGKGVEEIMHAFVAPAVRFCREHPAFMRIAGRVFAETDPKIMNFWASQFENVVKRFMEELSRALPEIPPPELFWRLFFVVGGLVFTNTHVAEVPRAIGDRFPAPTPEELEARMVTLATAALRAPMGVCR